MSEERERFPTRFFVQAYLFTWIIWLPLVLGGLGVIPIPTDTVTALYVPITMLAVFGPGASAVICLRKEQGQGAGLRYLESFLDFHLGWEAWVLPPLVFGSIGFTAWIVPELWGAPRLQTLLPTPWVFPLYVVLMVLLGGGQEELGWRGYAVDRLEAWHGPVAGNLVLSLLWACWHLPLWLIPGSSQTFMHFGGFLMLMTGYSFFYSWIRKRSGDRSFSGLWVHGWGNAFIPLWPTIVFQQGATQPRYWIWCGLVLASGLAVLPLSRRRGHG